MSNGADVAADGTNGLAAKPRRGRIMEHVDEREFEVDSTSNRHVTIDARNFARKHDLDDGDNVKKMRELMDRECAVVTVGAMVCYLVERTIADIIVIGRTNIKKKRREFLLLKRTDFLALYENARHTGKVPDTLRAKKVCIAAT